MSQPPIYAPQTEFLTYQAQQSWFPGQQLDVEFNAIDASISAIEANLAGIQKDDGTLANGIVDFPQLSPDLQLELAGDEFTSLTVAQFKQTTGVQVWVTDPQFGADRTGALDSTTAIQSAINAAVALAATQGLATVFLPAGVYRISSTLVVTASNIFIRGEAPYAVQLQRYSDFGPAVQFSNASAQIQNVGIADIQIDDIPAIKNTAGFSTPTNSPYQVIFDGVDQAYIKNLNTVAGSGSLALKGVINAWIASASLINAGTSELTLGGVGLYVGVSANSHLPAAYSSVIYVTDLEMEGNSKIADGVRVDGCDGLWMTNVHVQGTTNADYRFSHSNSSPMANLFARNCMADICTGNGVLCDGSQIIKHSGFEGSINCANAGGANKAGFLMSGSGGANDFTLDALVTGWGGAGVSLTGSNISNFTIRPRSIVGNSNTGSFAGIDLSCTAIGIAITGGAVGGGSEMPNIHVGASVSRVTIAGVLASSSAGYGVVIDSGATNVAITGCDLSNNSLGAISDSSGTVNKRFVGNLGAADVFAKGVVSIADNGTISSLTNLILAAAFGASIALEINGISTAYVTGTSVQPATDNTFTLGASSFRWSELYSTIIQTGSIVSLSNLLLSAATGSVIGLGVNGVSTAYITNTALQPSANATFSLGTSSSQWTNTYSAAYYSGANQVVGARATGWTVATGTPSRATFTTSGVSLATLAGVVMALEQDLIAHGLIGT